jgi:predicted nucleotidyltransferase
MSGPAPMTIDPAMAERVRDALAAIEREHRVRVLLAVESGSRAWGFPSPDSDYDVRFIYVRPVADYLTVLPLRDVIERPVDAVLDVSGWDIRKALRLLLRSNAVLQEWLTSPVRYVGCGNVRQPLCDLVADGADLLTFEYHYDHLARRAFGEMADAGDGVRLKSYCYALRAALALSWLRDRRAPPPMDVPALMAGLTLPDGLTGEISGLIERKAAAMERDVTARLGRIDKFIDGVLARPVGPACGLARPDMAARADALFASIVLRQPVDTP